MSLSQLIIDNSLTSKSTAEIVEALNTPSVNRSFTTPVGPQLLTQKLVAKYGKDIGTAKATGICQVFEGAAASSALFRRLLGSFDSWGMRLDDSDTRAMLEDIFTGDYASLGDELKAIGRYQVSLCEAAGLPTATEETVLTALILIANTATRSRLDGIMDGIRVTFDLNPNTTMVNVVNQLARGVLNDEQADGVAKALEG